MGAPITFKLSPEVLHWARVSMGMSIDEAAKKANVSVEKYASWENGQTAPTYIQLEKLASSVYKRPLAILLLPHPPQESSVNKEFRTISNVRIEQLKPEIRLALRRAKRYQLILEEVAPQHQQDRRTFVVTIDENPVIAANRFREFINLPVDVQKSWKPDDAFNHFQRKIESIGIYVFKMKMAMDQARAFCITGTYPIVVLNTDDSQNGRIFSLFHEVAHILLNTNDLFSDFDHHVREYEKIEKFCNLFAAAFLVPEHDFQLELKKQAGRYDDAFIQKLSKTYNVSNEVIARKLLFRRLIKEDYFWSKKAFWDEQARKAKQRINERLSDRDQGIHPGTKIIYEKGKPYVTSVLNAYEQGTISSSDVTNYLETKISNVPKVIEKLAS